MVPFSTTDYFEVSWTGSWIQNRVEVREVSFLLQDVSLLELPIDCWLVLSIIGCGRDMMVDDESKFGLRSHGRQSWKKV
jgi:hypothetical protein